MILPIVKKLLSFAKKHVKDIYVSSLLAIMSSFLSVAVFFLAYLFIATITGMQQADISLYLLASATALAIVLRYVLLIFSSFLLTVQPSTPCIPCVYGW